MGPAAAVAARPGADADACHKPPAACRPLSPAGAPAALGAAGTNTVTSAYSFIYFAKSSINLGSVSFS